MLRRVGLVRSKKERAGCVVRDYLASKNAASWLGIHTNSFFVLKSGRNGARSEATKLVLDDNWLINPTKERSSVRLVGTG